MDHQAAPLLTLNSINSCLLCEKDINGKFVKFTDKGWKKVVENAGRWKNLAIPPNDPYHLFPNVDAKIKNIPHSFGVAHERCRITFATKFELYASRYETTRDEKTATMEDEKQPSSSYMSHRDTRRTIGISGKKVCFICNVSKTEDDSPYNEGGLCVHSTSGEKLIERTKTFLSNSFSVHHTAACRFVRQVGGLDSNEIANVVYHQNCYIR